MDSTGAASHSLSAERWQRASALVTVLLTAAVLLAGCAAAWQPTMGVGADQREVEADLVLEVAYTTLSGDDLRCTYAAYLNAASGRAQLDAALATLRAHDWSTFGDDVKRYALAHPYTESGPDQAAREKIAFDMAAAEIVLLRADGSLPDDAGVGATTDCTGRVS